MAEEKSPRVTAPDLNDLGKTTTSKQQYIDAVAQK